MLTDREDRSHHTPYYRREPLLYAEYLPYRRLGSCGPEKITLSPTYDEYAGKTAYGFDLTTSHGPCNMGYNKTKVINHKCNLVIPSAVGTSVRFFVRCTFGESWSASGKVEDTCTYCDKKKADHEYSTLCYSVSAFSTFPNALGPCIACLLCAA
jgi:hypothetical protein